MKSVRHRFRTRASTWAVAIVAPILLSGCVMTFVDSCPALPPDVHAPVVAVASFENRSNFEGQWRLGDGMADLLVSELVRSRNFAVVERQYFEKLVGEIDRQKSGLFRPEGKTPVGRMKGAQYLIRGVINDFSQSGGGGLSLAIRFFVFLGRGYTARVSLTLTIIDIETGQIVSSTQSTGIVRTRSAYTEATYKGVTFGGDVFFATPLGEATQRAIRSGVREATKAMPRNPWHPMISGVRNTKIYINGGKDRGFQAGTLYVVRGPAEPITDPATGDFLAFAPGPKIGTIRITEVDERVSLATPVQAGSFERGQWISKESADAKGP